MDSTKELYSIVRNDAINYIKLENLSDLDQTIPNYSIFNRYWNDTMRHKYNLPQSYICFPEFERLCKLSKKELNYKESFCSKIYHRLFGYDFRVGFEPTLHYNSQCDGYLCCNLLGLILLFDI